MRKTILSLTAIATTLTLSLASVPAHGGLGDGDRAREIHLHARPELGNYVLRNDDGRIVCAEPLAEELPFLLSAGDASDLKTITPARKNADGLTIVLQGTTQLDGFPVAKQAFIDAARIWEERIKTPMTIIVKVDYGPTRFGEPYPDGVLGSTSSQHVGADDNYAELRAALIARSSTAAEAASFAALPPTSIPTDYGSTTEVIAPSANFRALGLLDPEADPGSEFGLGALPSIGFNSEVAWDFDPSNGIDGDKIDFEATVVHELGHALGFSSLVGYRELSSSIPIAVSVWDLFRFKPPVSLASVATAPRLLKSGGTHVFFAGDGTLNLSTGRPDHTGGDGNQASHWKTRYAGSYIGIMDPTGAPGDRDEITEADLAALDAMGYTVVRGSAPVLTALEADLDGDILSLSGSGTDADGNVTLAEAEYLDPTGASISVSEPFVLSTGFATDFDFAVDVPGLSAVRGAVRVRLTLIDGNGNRSEAAEAWFNQGDPGAPAITAVSYKSSKSALKIKAQPLSASTTVEVNGTVLTGVTIKRNKKGTALKLTGSLQTLGFRSGLNSVRLRDGALRSNIVVVTVTL